MDQARRDFWLHYLRMLANRMELRDWTVALSARPCEDGANAEIDRHRNHKYASISLCVGFDQRSDEDNRLTLVHELIHCHFNDSDALLDEARWQVDKTWLHLLCKNMGTAEERAISTLANIIAPVLPLPGAYENEDPGNAGRRDHSIPHPVDARERTTDATNSVD